MIPALTATNGCKRAEEEGLRPFFFGLGVNESSGLCGYDLFSRRSGLER